MWHEARKQERKIRGMMVDYKKRAERRREYYEKIKADPTQFLQLHGRKCKVHLDPAVAQAADSPANMMPWQGHSDNLIDRFDGRAHLDHITEYKSSKDGDSKVKLSDEDEWDERQASYERYRILVENDFLGLSEEKFLLQIYLEEQYGPINRGSEEEKKKLSDKKAAIGYVYEDSTPLPSSHSKDEDDAKKDSDSDIDLAIDMPSDLPTPATCKRSDKCHVEKKNVTVDVAALTNDQSKEMNEHSYKYGMVEEDFIRFMIRDKEEAESLRLAKEAEEEKAMYSGRKSRRERRAFREKKLQGRKISPPSYAARESPTYDPYERSKSPSRSRSKSPVDAGKITFITSFGEEVSDESGNERRQRSRPSFVSSMTAVTGPVLPSSKYGGRSSEASSIGSNVNNLSPASHSTSSSHLCGANRRSVTSSQNVPNASISSCASSVRNRSDSDSKSRSRSRSSSSSPSRSRKRDRHSKGSNRKTDYRSGRSYSRSPLRSYRHTRHSRKRLRGRSYSRSNSSGSQSSSSRSHSRSYTRSTSRSKSYSRSSSSSRSASSQKHSSLSPNRYSFRTKSHSRSPNGHSPSRQGTSSQSSAHCLNVGASGNSSLSTNPSAVSRYYGRRREAKDDSSSLSDEDVDDSENRKHFQTSSSSSSKNKNFIGKAVFGTKGQKLTPQEKLKRRMQAAINKQYKADKRAEMKKIEKQVQERLDREEELRELAIKFRRRERERRHRRQDSVGTERSSDHKHGRSRSRSYDSSESDSSRSSSNSRSRSRSPRSRASRSRSHSRDRSHSRNGSDSDSSHKLSSKHTTDGQRSKRRSRSPLVHY